MLQHQAGLDDLQIAVHVSCFVCHLDRKWFSQADTCFPSTFTAFCLHSKGFLICPVISASIPVVWKAESAWTGGLSPVQRGKRCNGARTASPAGSEPTPLADSPAASSSRCSPRWMTDPTGRPRCPHRPSRSPTASSNLHKWGEKKRGCEGKIKKNVYPLTPDTLSSVCQPLCCSRSPNASCLGGSWCVRSKLSSLAMWFIEGAREGVGWRGEEEIEWVSEGGMEGRLREGGKGGRHKGWSDAVAVIKPASTNTSQVQCTDWEHSLHAWISRVNWADHEDNRCLTGIFCFEEGQQGVCEDYRVGSVFLRHV